MTRTKQILGPIGFEKTVARIESICEDSAVYKRCGIKPHNFFITLESGDGQTTLVNFLADMFEENSVRRFGGLDAYLEYKLDGTMAQLNNIFFDIKSSAVYTNDFEGIIAFDITALAGALHEKQTEYFFSEVGKCAEHATVVFFASPKLKNLQTLADAVCSAVRDVEIINEKPYTESELAKIAIRAVEENGIVIEDADKALEVMCKIVCLLGIEKACETESIVYAAVRNADYGSFTTTLSPEMLTAAFAENFEKVKGGAK